MVDQPNEIKTAETSESLTKATGDTVITDRRKDRGTVEAVVPPQVAHKRGSGFGTVKFDGAAPPAHERKKLSDDPHRQGERQGARRSPEKLPAQEDS